MDEADKPPVDQSIEPEVLERRRALVRELSMALRPLHRLFIDVARAEFEAVHGPVGGPGALHRLVAEDPSFQWLYPLLQRMVQLDDMADDMELLLSGDLAVVRRETEALLVGAAPAGEGQEPVRGELAVRYVELLQSRPEFVMAHVDVRRALNRLG